MRENKRICAKAVVQTKNINANLATSVGPRQLLDVLIRCFVLFCLSKLQVARKCRKFFRNAWACASVSLKAVLVRLKRQCCKYLVVVVRVFNW